MLDLWSSFSMQSEGYWDYFQASVLYIYTENSILKQTDYPN